MNAPEAREFFRSPMAGAEWHAGFVADPSGQARRLLPVRVEEVEPAGQSLSNLGDLLHDQGDLDGARHLFERALAIRVARLGPDHPDTARNRQRLADVVAELEDRS